MPPRWVFTEEMVIHIINGLNEYKSDREGQGFDFESDLIHLYNEVRKKMARIFPEHFGPEIAGQEVDGLDETADETAFRRQFHDDQKKIKLGYDRVKKKVKTIRADFAKAVVTGQRSGSGKIVKEFWDDLLFLWGGTPGTEALPFGVSTEVNMDKGMRDLQMIWVMVIQVHLLQMTSLKDLLLLIPHSWKALVKFLQLIHQEIQMQLEQVIH